MLFQNAIANEDSLYSRIRDYPKDKGVKNQIEMLWNVFESIAPKDFLRNLQTSGAFHQRWWELYCGVGLLRICTEVKSNYKDKGPDFEIVYNNKKCFIEAIAPKCGEAKDYLPPMEYSHKPTVKKLPENEFLLRISNGIVEKQKKYKAYLDKGIVCKNDGLIIAISACDLAQYGSLMDCPVPAPFKVLLGYGFKRINLKTGENDISKRKSVLKKSGAQVSFNLFELEETRIISGIIYSNTDPLNSPDEPESTFVIVRNPNALVPLEMDMFKNGNKINIY
ncbi:MAG: hypothetical protein EOM59_05080 [Clostridia bacterium]|nr:hypothetical protein [Clostridia bacterium]